MENPQTSNSQSIPEDEIIIRELIPKNNGDILTMNYKRSRLLGKGGFASVYEFICLENKKVFAGKIINKNSLSRARARQKLMFEIKIHRALHHPHIVSFERFFEDADNIYILLELCQNQTMNELLRRRKRLTELEVQSYLAQMVSALKYLHSNRVIHRDLKLGNLFLNSKMEIKLGDFGLATKLEFDGERKRTVCGTPNYIAPEILDGNEGHSFEADIWSLGVLLYTISLGRPPFETQDIKVTYRKIKLCAYSYPEKIPISDELKDLISKLIVVDPLLRMPLDGILAHEFMTRNQIPKSLPLSTLACPPSFTYVRQFTAGPSAQSSRDMRSSSLSRVSDLKAAISKEEQATDRTHRLVHVRQSSEHKDRTSQVNKSEIQTTAREVSLTSSRKIAVVSNYTNKDCANVFVKKWVDYSNKYGLGYLLSNSSVGIYFNDTSKLICNSQGAVKYICKSPSSNSEVVESYSLKDYPESLKKKITLLEHFRKYLASEACGTGDRSLVHIKKWMQTEHATIFRLSNKTVQIRFMDKTELILSTELKTVVFIDKSGRCEAFPLKTAVQSDNKELSTRINYTTEMITRMLNPNAPA